MKIVDANVLIYVVNRNAAQHAAVSRWWDAAMNSDEAVGLSWGVISAFIRISTRQGIFPQPLAPDAAIKVVDAWLAADIVRLVVEKENHWNVLRDLVSNAGTAGNLVTDAHLAALAITHGATLVSCDSDFARFQGLRWHNPLNEA